MIDDKQRQWLEHYGILKGAPIDKSQFEQQWPTPLAVNQSMPKPWYVATYSGAALGNVLRSNYGATFRDGHFYVAGGDMMRIYKSGELYGTHGGTIFVLYDPLWRSQPELDRILEVAHGRGIRIETLQAAAL